MIFIPSGSYSRSIPFATTAGPKLLVRPGRGVFSGLAPKTSESVSFITPGNYYYYTKLPTENSGS